MTPPVDAVTVAAGTGESAATPVAAAAGTNVAGTGVAGTGVAGTVVGAGTGNHRFDIVHDGVAAAAPAAAGAVIHHDD